MSDNEEEGGTPRQSLDDQAPMAPSTPARRRPNAEHEDVIGTPAPLQHHGSPQVQETPRDDDDDGDQRLYLSTPRNQTRATLSGETPYHDATTPMRTPADAVVQGTPLVRGGLRHPGGFSFPALPITPVHRNNSNSNHNSGRPLAPRPNENSSIPSTPLGTNRLLSQTSVAGTPLPSQNSPDNASRTSLSSSYTNSISRGGLGPNTVAQQAESPPLTPLSDLNSLATGRESRASNGSRNLARDFNPPDEQEEAAAAVVEEATLIRGTDLHLRTAANAFQDFLRNFVSVKESTKAAQRLRRRANAPGGGDGGDDSSNDDDDDDAKSHVSEDSELNDSDAEEEMEPFYLGQLKEILLNGRILPGDLNRDSLTSDAATHSASLEINAIHLYYHSPACQRLYHQLISYPAEVVPLMDLILSNELERLFTALQDEGGAEHNESLPEDVSSLPRVQVRPFNLRNVSHMRALDPNAIDCLLSIRGMVVRSSPIIPDLKVAHFSCTICGHTVDATIDRGRIHEPTHCPTCNCKSSYDLVHNRSIYADKQMVRIQETPDEVPAGETPASVVVFAYDDLVDSVKPGDRVEITGIFRAQPRRVNPKITRVKSVYKTYLDVIHFRRITAGSTSSNNTESRTKKKKKSNVDDDEANGRGISETVANTSRFTEERVRELEELSKDPDIYEKLVAALAPSIYELDDVKKGVLCMLFGGNNRRVRKGTSDRNDRRKEGHESDEEEEEAEQKLHKRGDINILLCGDPGTSKSQLLGYVHKLSPRGVYTSGKGSSAVGLTASVVRDPETRDLVLESGALVLSDLGICCIDEFDKMSDTTRAILHEAMEQQTVSIAKAGIIATLNARTSILASANPSESRYNPKMSVVENIKLPPTLLSRFDLIYLILDAPNVDGDRRLAQHLVGLYYETPNVVQPPMDHSLLRDYIAYAREYIHPELSDLATRELIASYLEMRRMGSAGGSRTISATPRQLESLIRLSEAFAKMSFSRVVLRTHVKEAVRLMRVATQAAATDPRTGRIDMDMITTGRSTVEREMEETLNSSLKELLSERRGNRMAVGDVRRQLTEITNVTIGQDDLMESLRIMEADGVIQLNERAQTIFVRAGVAH